jgi:predicted dehydrogenase
MLMKITGFTIIIFCLMLTAACNSSNDANTKADSSMVRLITLAPGHFHAALVQKNMYPEIDSVVHVYAPEGKELQAHLDLIKQYNSRAENPTHWVEKLYTGDDYLDKMLNEKAGNVVVLAGNNQQKTDYIKRSVEAGLNVLGDKPMAINAEDFTELKNAFQTAEKNQVLLYDIMTERSEITNTLQKEFAHIPSVFGTLQQGTTSDPAVRMESVHYFYKYVSGNVLTRPDWFFDPKQQGDAITDVGTHLLDLIQWECFPDSIINYEKDINVINARIWPTPIMLSQFSSITKEDKFPGFLQPYITNDSVLQTHANGEINYTIKGIHARITPRWEYKATAGGDSHYSLLKGTKASLEIKQGKAENYKPVLYIYPNSNSKNFADTLKQAVEKLNEKYPGISVEPINKSFKVVIPEKYDVGHEAHFAQVMERFLQYLKEKKLPAWEVPGMLAKYYTATKGLEIATEKK